MKKRIISLLLALTFMLSIVPSFGITASATSSDVTSIESEAVITVEEIWGNPGKTVDLDLILTGNPGILGATITISWDENLTLVADASGEAFDHMTYTSPSRYVASGTNFVWFGNEVDEAIDGTILTLTFRVSETAQNNDILPLRVTYTQGDVIDENDNDVTLNITDGHICVINYQPGDITDDGRVNARDLVRLSQYISDGCKTDPEGYNAEVVADACDVNGDGRVNARDLIKLSQYISDGSQTNPGGYNAVLKPAKMPECEHDNMQATVAKEASCTEVGNIAYWYCSGCGKYFSDAAGTTEITFADTVLTNGAHTLTAVVAKSATCTDVGNIAYWNCSVCEKYFGDANATTEILLADTVISAQGHDLTKITENAASCTEVGNITYWYCGVCQKSYSDEDAETEIDADSTVITAKGHAVQAVIAKSATCTQPGNVAYWYCSACEGCFGDSDAKNEISLAETMIDATGHGENLKYIEKVEATIDTKGNEAYWKCSVCGKCYSDANAETEVAEEDMVIPIVPSYVITYYDEKQYSNTENINVVKYKQHISNTLPAPILEGYTFMGWYTGVDGTGEKIVIIPVGNTENKTLYAHWTPKNYEIVYYHAADNSNPTQYTVEDEIILTNPKGAGLSFSHWTDKNGAVVTKIEKGTTGNIELTANWKSVKNMAISTTEDRDFIIAYDEKNTRYHIAYELGTIQNVVLDELYSYKFDATSTYSYSLSETVNVGEEVAKSVAQALAQSITATNDWSNTTQWVETNSTTTTQDFTLCPELEITGVKVKLFEYSNGKTEASENSYSNANYIGYSTGSGQESSSSISSTLSYVKNSGTTVTKTLTLDPSNSPAGLYSYVHAGDVRVYAIITYDPDEMNYYADIYSIVYRTFETTLYEPVPEFNLGINIESCEALSFYVPMEELEQRINNSYYVQYDANGGTGVMPTSVFVRDEELPLYHNRYVRDGYTFDGWEHRTDFGGSLYQDGQEVCNLGTDDETVVLYAKWVANPYVITFDANGGNTLSPNTMQVVYDSAYGTLPTPERNGYTFDGWYLGNELINDESKVEKAENHTLTARWTANTYTVTFDATGGIVTPASIEVSYASIYGTLPEPSREGYAFVGWFTESTGGIRITSETPITFTEPKIIYAQWIPAVEVWEATKENGRRGIIANDYTVMEYLAAQMGYSVVLDSDNFIDSVDPINLDLIRLKELGYTSVRIKITLTMQEVADGYQEFWVYNDNGTLWYVEFEHGSGYENTSAETYTFSSNDLDINLFDSNSSFYVKYGANGKDGDTWLLGATTITIEVIK